VRRIGEWNPIDAVVAAVRTRVRQPRPSLRTRRPHSSTPVLAAILWTALLLAITIPLTIRRFAQRTARMEQAIGRRSGAGLGAGPAVERRIL
jgi:hypothetical protein